MQKFKRNISLILLVFMLFSIFGGIPVLAEEFGLPDIPSVSTVVYGDGMGQVDKNELQAKISSANSNKATAVASVDGSDTEPDNKWVTQEEMTTYQVAIDTAQEVYDKPDATQPDVDNAVSALAIAIINFNDTKKAGTKRPFTVNVRIEANDRTIVSLREVSIDDLDLSKYGVTTIFTEPKPLHAIIKALESVEIDCTDTQKGLSHNGGTYITMIDGLSQGSTGTVDGWMYYVDDIYVDKGINEFTIYNGQTIVVFFQEDWQKNTYSWFDKEEVSIKNGEVLELVVNGSTYDMQKDKVVTSPVSDATILVNNQPYIVDGTKIKTNQKGEAAITFMQEGTYVVSAERFNQATGKRDITRPYCKVTVEKGDSVVDKTPLINTIKEAEEVLENAAIGSSIGEYPQDVKDLLQKSIDEARNTVEKEGLTFQELKEANSQLQKAILMFNDSINKDCNLEEVIDSVLSYYEINNKENDFITSMALRRVGVDTDILLQKMNIYNMENIHNNSRNVMNIIAAGGNPRDYRSKDYTKFLIEYNYEKENNSGYIAKAIIAMDMAGVAYDKEKVVAALLSKVHNEGNGKMFFGSKTSDYWDDFWEEWVEGEFKVSVEDTAWSLIALAGHKEQGNAAGVIEGVKEYLKSKQGSNGLIENSAYTSLVIQALIALGEDPKADFWHVQNGEEKVSLLDAILTCRINNQFGLTPNSSITSDIATPHVLAALADLNTMTSMYKVLRYEDTGIPVKVQVQGKTEIYNGDVVDLEAKAYDKNNIVVKDAAISWESSDESIAVVQNGTIQTLQEGEVKITAYVTGNRSTSDSIKIYIIDPPQIDYSERLNEEIKFLKDHYEAYNSYEFLASPAAVLSGMDKAVVQAKIYRYSNTTVLQVAKTIIALAGAELDPREDPFKENTINHVERLRNAQNQEGENKGKFIINEFSDQNSIITQAYCIIAMDLVDGEYDKELAVKALLSMLNDPKYTAELTYTNIKTEAVAATALSKHKNIAGVEQKTNELISFLKENQNKDGAFDIKAGSSFANSPVATGAVVQALLANDIDPLSWQWTKGGRSILDGMLKSKYIGTDASKSGYAQGEGLNFENAKASHYAFSAFVAMSNTKSIYEMIKENITKESPVVKEKLETAKAAAAAKNKEDYTEESYAVLAEALAKTETTQEEVDAKVLAINQAIAGLVEKPEIVDKQVLEAEIIAANENKALVVISIDGTDIYPSQKWVTQEQMIDYTSSITAAQAIFGKPKVTQAEVDGGVTALVTATETFNSAKQLGRKIESNLTVKEQLDRNFDFIVNTVDNPTFGTIAGEWSILSLARGGYAAPEGYYDLYYRNIENEVTKLMPASGSKPGGRLDRNKGTEHSRLILGLTSIGRDITNVAGYDIIEALADFDYLTTQGINGPIFGLIAFDSYNYEIPIDENVSNQTTREKMIEHILSREINGGGWALGGTTPDPDATAMAIQGLTPYYQSNPEVKAAVDRAIIWLSNAQRTDGGYRSWGSVNSESCAQVIVALTGLGIDPHTDERFIKNDISAVDNLMSYAVPNGGFMHVKPDGGSEAGVVSGMATDQGTYALVAYDRFMDGKTRLYDMNDVVMHQPGINKEQLQTAITEANENKASVVVSIDGLEVDLSQKWVTQEPMQVYTEAIVVAQIILSKPDATQDEVDNGVMALTTATEIFNSAKKAGNKQDIVIIPPKPNENNEVRIFVEADDNNYLINITDEDLKNKFIIEIHEDREAKTILQLTGNKLPQMDVNKGEISVAIPQGAEVVNGNPSALELITFMDINDAEIKNKISSVIPAGKKLDAIAQIFSIGSQSRIEFNEFITLTFRGIKGKEAAYIQNGQLHIIERFGSDVEGLNSSKTEYTYDSGNDLIVKTKHFTDFIAYTITSDSSSGGVTPQPKNKITLSIDKKTINKGYVLSPREVSFTSGESVWDVLKREMDNNGISYTHSWHDKYNSVYVEWIAGDGEFDHGSGSGWMYNVNGWYPNYGASKYTLKNGDVVQVRYTTDLGVDLGEDISKWKGGGSSSGGGGTSVTSEKDLKEISKTDEQPKVDLEDQDTARLAPQAILELENKQTLTIVKEGVRVEIPVVNLKTDGFKKLAEEQDAQLEVAIKELNATQKQEVVTKAKVGEGTGIFDINGKIYDISLTMVAVDDNNKEIRAKLTYYNQPIKITMDLSRLNISEEDIAQLTAVRYEVDEKGNINAVKLGGEYDPKTKQLVFYTSSLSYYGVAKAQELTKISLVINKLNAQVNGTSVFLDQPAVIIDSRTMVPLRFIAEAMKAEVEWNSEERKITINNQGKTLTLYIDQAYPGLDTPPTIIKGRTMIPLRYVAQQMGGHVLWHSDVQEVYIVK